MSSLLLYFKGLPVSRNLGREGQEDSFDFSREYPLGVPHARPATLSAAKAAGEVGARNEQFDVLPAHPFSHVPACITGPPFP